MSETLQGNRENDGGEQGPVSIPRRPLSRRALIKAAGIAPFMVLARQAWATPTPSLMAAVAGIAQIPPTQLEEVRGIALTYAKEYHKGKVLDVAKFDLVANALWLHFHSGLGRARPDSKTEPILLKLMYQGHGAGKASGIRVVDSILDDKFDPLGNDYQTNVCAYVCGHKVAIKALAKKGEFDKTMYDDARQETEDEMCEKLNKACGSGPRPDNLGFGC